MPTPPTVSIKTVGCRLNQAESEMLARRFESAGFKVVGAGLKANIVVIHSCAVTSAAERKSARYAHSAGNRDPRPYVVVAGCACEVNPAGLAAQTGADLVIGQNEKMNLPDLLPEALRAGAVQPQPQRRLPRRTRVLIKVQDGCDFACAYCVVPRARGRPESVPFDVVIEAARDAARAGFREAILTGANLGTYRCGNRRLTDVIRSIEAIPGIDRVRLSSLEPGTCERDIVDIMAASKKLCRSLNLPLQSGDDSILAAMGRRYTTAEYASFVEYAVSRVERIGIATDLVTGLPGEDDASFETTLAFAARMPFSRLHVFPYSRRPGTRAESMPRQVPRPAARQRAAILSELGLHKQRAFARQFLGREVTVLIEKAHADGTGTGWTSEYVPAKVISPGIHRNDIVPCIVKSADDGALVGQSAA